MEIAVTYTIAFLVEQSPIIPIFLLKEKVLQFSVITTYNIIHHALKNVAQLMCRALNYYYIMFFHPVLDVIAFQLIKLSSFAMPRIKNFFQRLSYQTFLRQKLDRVWKDEILYTPYLSIFSPNARKYGPKKLQKRTISWKFQTANA